jgi:Domain of unknown function (DUF2019)
MENKLIKEYIESAISHGEATLKGDFETANKAHDSILKIYNELKIDDQLQVLKGLLKNENSSVRLWSATHLLAESEAEALETLEDVAKGDSIIGFNAKMVIKEWKAGRLK